LTGAPKDLQPVLGAGPKTLDGVILEIEKELASVGQAVPEMSLFRGKVSGQAHSKCILLIAWTASHSC